MNKNNYILIYWNAILVDFSENITRCKKRLTKKAIHDLRVDIKRIRSTLRFRKRLSGKKWKDNFKASKDLFKALGSVRDFDMSVSTLRKYSKNENLQFPELIKYLARRRTAQARKIKEDINLFDHFLILQFNPEIYRFAGPMSNLVIVRKIKLAVKSELKKTRALSKNFDKNIHQIRKQLKNVYYWLKMIPKEKFRDLIDIQILDKSLDKLGKWQDLFILKGNINSYLTTESPEELEKNSLRLFTRKISREQVQLAQKAKEEWNKLFK